MKKRLVAFLLVLIMVLGMLPVSAMAADSSVIKSAFLSVEDFKAGNGTLADYDSEIGFALPTGSVKVGVGESVTDSGTVMFYARGAAIVTGYNNLWDAFGYDNSILNVDVSIAEGTTDTLVVKFTGLKAGNTKVKVQSGISCRYVNGAFEGETFSSNVEITYNVTVGDGGSTDPSGKPNAPTASDIGAFPDAGKAVLLHCVDAGARGHDATASSLNKVQNGYSVGEVVENPGTYYNVDGGKITKEQFPWMCVVTVHAAPFIELYNSNFSERYGVHKLAGTSNATATLHWFWHNTYGWQYLENPPIQFNITRDTSEKTYTLNYYKNTTDTVTNMPEPNPQTEKSNTGMVTFTVSNARPSRDGYTFLGWAGNPDATTATVQPGNTITTPRETTNLYAVWQSNTPPTDKPDKPTKNDVTGVVVDIVCVTTTGTHDTVQYPLGHPTDAQHTIGEVVSDGAGGYICPVTVRTAWFVQQASNLVWKVQHTPTAQTITFNLTYDKNSKTWVKPAANPRIEATHEVTPPTKPTALDGSFAIVCKNNKATHPYKADYIATPSQYTISDVQKDEQGYYVTATVTVAPNLVAYNKATRVEHRLVDEQDATLTITFRYDTEATVDGNRKWKQQGDLPVVEVICKEIEAPTREDIFGALNGLVTVTCINRFWKDGNNNMDCGQGQYAAKAGIAGQEYTLVKGEDDTTWVVTFPVTNFVKSFKQNPAHHLYTKNTLSWYIRWKDNAWTSAPVEPGVDDLVKLTHAPTDWREVAKIATGGKSDCIHVSCVNGETGVCDYGITVPFVYSATDVVSVEPEDGVPGSYIATFKVDRYIDTCAKACNDKNFKDAPRTHKLLTQETVQWRLYATPEADEKIGNNVLNHVWAADPVTPGTDDVCTIAHNWVVTFDPNGGTPVPLAQEVEYGHTATKPVEPTLKGYTFDGWYLDGEEEPFDFGTTITSDITLTAKWHVTLHNIYAYARLNSYFAPLTTSEFDTPVTLNEATLSRLGLGSYNSLGYISIGSFTFDAMPLTSDLYFGDDAELSAVAEKLATDIALETGVSDKIVEKIAWTALYKTVNEEDMEPGYPAEAGYQLSGNLNLASVTFRAGAENVENMPAVNYTYDDGAIDFYDFYFAGDTITLPTTEPTREGYSFKGWSVEVIPAENDADHLDADGADDAADETLLKAGDTYTITAGGVIFTAQWKLNTYIIASDLRINGDTANLADGKTYAWTHRYGGNYGETIDYQPMFDALKARALEADKANEPNPTKVDVELRFPGSKDRLFNEEIHTYGQDGGGWNPGVKNTAYIWGYAWTYYDVTFVTGVDGLTVEPQLVKSGDKATAPTDVTRLGYDFKGWYTDEALTVQFAFDTPITRKTTLYAKWEARTDTPYKVKYYIEKLDGTYDYNDSYEGRGTTDTRIDATKVHNKSYENFTLDLNHPDTVQFGNIAGDGSLVLKLFYTRNTYDYTVRHIKQLPDGAYDEANAEVETLSGKFEALAAVTAKDYGEHYPTNDAGTKQNIKIEKGLTIDVKYDLDEHTLTFETNGGSAINSVTVRHGNAVARPADPTKDKYTFIGWYADPEFTEEYDFATVLEADKTIYAKFELTSTPIGDIYVRYDVLHIKQLPDGTYDLANAEVEHLSAKKDTTVTAVIKDYRATHHVNVNRTLSKLTGTAIQPYMGVDGKPVYTILSVYYDLDFHTLTFDTMGGSKIAPETVRHGLTVAKPKDPVNGGYIFDGWYTDKTFRHRYDFSTPLTEDITIYAKWFLIVLPGVTVKKNTPKLNTADHFAYVQGYPDGTVKPAGNITRAETAAILFRLMDDASRKTYYSTKSGFRDVASGSWYNTYVATLNNAGVITDSSNGYFRPNEAITRAELAAMLAKFSETTGAANYFNDVSAKYWAANAIAICAKLGWITGYPDGTFRPDKNVTRAELMAMINRATGRAPKSADAFLPGMKTWIDNTADKWYYLDVQEATNSHSYTVKGSETWTALTSDPNWSLYE